jgi:hypothetical protein
LKTFGRRGTIRETPKRSTKTARRSCQWYGLRRSEVGARAVAEEAGFRVRVRRRMKRVAAAAATSTAAQRGQAEGSNAIIVGTTHFPAGATTARLKRS